MCFHSKQSKSAQELENRFKIPVKKTLVLKPSEYNGFEHPMTPVISSAEPNIIQLFQWGLIPSWAKDTSIQKNTLNAKSETLHEKPAFKNVQHQRCLVIADAFYEWQWLDSKGKEKQKYELTMPSNELFAFAGIWSDWINPVTHEKRSTYAILTAEANELMQKIHNTKKRMPLIVAREHEDAWLKTGISKFDNDKLIANKTGEIFSKLFDSLF